MRTAFLLLNILCSNAGFSQSTIVFKGNTFVMSQAGTVEIYDPVSGKIGTEAATPEPISMNGEKIYETSATMTRPAFKSTLGKETKLVTLLFDSLKNDLELLPDGEYIIDIKTPVISKEGKLVYYRMNGIKQLTEHKQSSTTKMNDNGKPATYTRMSYTADDKSIPMKMKNVINNRASYLLEHLPAMSPGLISNKSVNVTGELFHSGSCAIKVAGHVASFHPEYFTL